MRHLPLLALLFAGCAATVSSTQVNQPPVAMVRHTPDQIDVFTSGPPARPHTDVAVLEAEPGLSERSTADLIGRMREQAAAEGCDGLVVTGIDTQATRHDERKTVTGTCIVYAPPMTSTAP